MSELPVPPVPPGADAPLDAADEALLATLASALQRHDPVPAGLTGEIRFRLSVQALHAEVAEIVRQGVDQPVLRGPEYARTETISFTGGELSALLTITPLDEGAVRVDGWLTGEGYTGAGANVQVLHAGGPARDQIAVDQHGRFAWSRLARGEVQFLFTPADPQRRPVVTRHTEL